MTTKRWQQVNGRMSGRDRSGRAPRASRAGAFHQAVSDWDVPGPTPDVEPPTDPVPSRRGERTDDDATRGDGY